MPPPGQHSDGAASQSPPQPTAKVHLATPSGEIAVSVEIVSTPAKIQRGLMYRRHLPTDTGMLFLMGKEYDWEFWMRNTLIPLDIIFIKKDMTVAGIAENAKPLDETLVSAGQPSLYVLEVSGGWTKEHGVTAGTRVRFDIP